MKKNVGLNVDDMILKKDNRGCCVLPLMKIYYKAKAIKLVWCWAKTRK